MKTLLIFVLLSAQTPLEQAILALSGASCMEELSADAVARYERLQRHPLNLNRCSRSALAASGLLSGYQIASLIEHRSRTGAIMSWSELGLVDGFSPEFVDHLRNFVSIDGHTAPGTAGSCGPLVYGSVSSSSGMDFRQDRQGGGGGYHMSAWDGRIRLEAGSPFGAELYWTFSPDFTGRPFGPGTVSAAYYGKGTLSRLVLGHFNARFGQGLMQWSGFRLSGFSSIQAFSRNPSGLTPTGSVTAELCGAAAELEAGPFDVSLACSIPGSVLISSVCHHTRRTTVSVTALARPADGAGSLQEGMPEWNMSADCRISIPLSSVFAEAGYSSENGFAGCAGILFVPVYGYKFALLLRHYSPQYGERDLAALGAQWPWGFASLECSARHGDEFRTRLLTTLRKEFVFNALSIEPSLRYALKCERVLSGEEHSSRHEFRAELECRFGRIRLRPRVDLVILSSRGLSDLACLESGWESERFAAYLKAGAFDIPDWEGRIYVYGRSVPGSFNVPAYRGRGFFGTVYLRVAVRRGQDAYLTGNIVSYPCDPVPRDGKAALCLMWSMKF